MAFAGMGHQVGVVDIARPQTPDPCDPFGRVKTRRNRFNGPDHVNLKSLRVELSR